MAKFWSLLFLSVPLLGVAVFFWAPTAGYWLPKDVSTHGHQIDHLWMFILVLTGLVFVATEIVLFWFLWRFGKPNATEPVKFTHGSHNLEVIWTILPAATLLFIAIYQMNAWADVKIRNPAAQGTPVFCRVTARQFEWRLTYPGKDGELGTPDDVHALNDMHVPVNQEILIHLESMDVLHDFFLPNLRIKQDAVPGMMIPVWFRATEQGAYDLVCAELCGWGHYKMKGRLTVESQEKFDAWLDETWKQQEATQ